MIHEVHGDELKLIQEATAGAVLAFEVLVRRYQDRLYGFIYRWVNDHELALDLTQETFMKSWQGLRNFQGASSFYTWLFRIARNVIVSNVRQRAARPQIRGSIGSVTEGTSGGFGEPESPMLTPEQELVTREQKELLLAAVANLPEDYREVVILRDMQEHSYEDIAELLLVPVGTVRSRLHRARSLLRERLLPIIGPR
ncbi:MAG TPA: sigma-70 family RNA polymerase sigma factor [Planctomycetota bacterium]|nr:sigma-70 family RNA polymerase sigma factor [Planctomycetota bacterium]